MTAPASPSVAFVASQLSLGGAERQLAILARGLHAAGDPVAVACLSQLADPYADQLREAGVPVTLMPRTGNWDLRRLLALRRWVRERRPRAVCAFGEFATAYAHYALAGLRPRPPVVGMLRRGSSRLAGMKRRLIARALARVDLVYANSETGRRYARETLGLSRESVRILPNAIPEEVFAHRSDPAATREALGLPAGEPVVLYVGRDAREKDIPTLVETLRRLEASGAVFRALVVGPGLAAPPPGAGETGERTSWLGRRDDVPSLMGAADVVLLTSRSEGTPNVVLEAMALGRPVVATDAGDVRRLLGDGEAGRVVAVGDAGALAAALSGLLGSAGERERAGQAGRARARSAFSLERAMDLLRADLASLHDAGGGSAA